MNRTERNHGQKPEIIALKLLRSSAGPFVMGALLFIFDYFLFYIVFSASINHIPNVNNLVLINGSQTSTSLPYPYNSVVASETNKYEVVSSIITTYLVLFVIGSMLAIALIGNLYLWNKRASAGFKILKTKGYNVKQGSLGVHMIFGALIIFSLSFTALLPSSVFTPHIIGPISQITYYLITLSPVFQLMFIGPYMLPIVVALIIAIIGSIFLEITYVKLFRNRMIRTGGLLTILGFAISLIVAIVGGLILVIAFILTYAGLRKVEHKLENPASVTKGEGNKR